MTFSNFENTAILENDNQFISSLQFPNQIRMGRILRINLLSFFKIDRLGPFIIENKFKRSTYVRPTLFFHMIFFFFHGSLYSEYIAWEDQSVLIHMEKNKKNLNN